MSYLITAVDKNMGIGLYNNIPWKDTEEGKKDMLFFRKQTKNNAILIGYNTWKSIGRLLPDRLNIIITKSHYDEMKIIESNHYNNDKLDNNIKRNTEVKIFNNLIEGLNFSLDYENKTNKRVYICGGEKIYKEYLQRFTPKTIYLTKIKNNYNCDVFFPSDLLYNFTNNNSYKETIIDDIFYTYDNPNGGYFINKHI